MPRDSPPATSAGMPTSANRLTSCTTTRHPDGGRALEQEGANLRAVARWATVHADSALLVSLARRLWPWLWTSGRVGELREAVSQALAALPADPAPQDLGYLHYVEAYAQGLTGDFAGALVSVTTALRLYEITDGDDTALLVGAARLVRGTVTLGLGHAGGVDADLETPSLPPTGRTTRGCSDTPPHTAGFDAPCSTTWQEHAFGAAGRRTKTWPVPAPDRPLRLALRTSGRSGRRAAATRAATVTLHTDPDTHIGTAEHADLSHHRRTHHH